MRDMEARPDSDTLVREALAADAELREALNDRNIEVIERRYAPEFTLNSPAGTIQSRQETVELLARSQARQLDHERTIEAA